MNYRNCDCSHLKRYAIDKRSYDFLAWNKRFITNTAVYTFVQEVWKLGSRFIVANRRVIGTDNEEIVKVVIRYD